MKRIFAFTLSEILITLAIIGVVSALTLPSLSLTQQNKVCLTSIKKAYSLTAQALQQYMTESNAASIAETRLTSLDGVEIFLKQYLKISKDCGESRIGGSNCLAETYTDLDGAVLDIESLVLKSKIDAFYCVRLKMGATVCMAPAPGLIVFDINGKKAPNIKGRDLYAVVVNEDGTISDEPEEKCFLTTTLTGCLTRIQKAGWQMNY